MSTYQGGSPEDPFRRSLAQLVGQLLQESHQDAQPVGPLLRGHLGVVEAHQLPVHSEELPGFELANLQLGLDAALARPGYEVRVLGLAGPGRGFSGAGLGDLMTSPHFGVGPPEYVNVPVGPDRTLPCLDCAVLLASTPEGPLCLLVRRGEDHGFMHRLVVQAVAPRPDAAQCFLADLRRLMAEHDVFRGQLITVEADRNGAPQVVFLERPRMQAHELVLPEGVLARVERHVIGPTRHREALRAAGRHLARGLLLWGPPGTGKTHTVRYLTARLSEATVIILSGASLGMVGAFGALARRLAPAVVVLEDVDLIAQERTFGPFGSSPALFELMNEMSGLGEDADVAFVLTTNRPDALEPALAARPGRVDLAVEIPLPDADGRRRLLELYSRGLDLSLVDPEPIVVRTAGVTASFFKELLRKAALAAAETGRQRVDDAILTSALDELLDDTAALTRVLLGSAPPGASAAPSPHAWLEDLPSGGGYGVLQGPMPAPGG
jgi:ATPase family protein associated with various cellular activities (AAA)